MSDSNPERKLGTPGLGTPDTINSIVFVDPETGATLEYSGPYSFRRDGGCWETDIPVGLYNRGGIENGTATRLSDRVGDIAIACADACVEASGTIEAADVIDGTLTICVDDPTHVTPGDLDVDTDTDANLDLESDSTGVGQ